MASKALVTESPAALVQGSPEERTKRRQWGLLATGAVGGVLVALYAVVTPFLAPALRKVCLPFVPATSTQIENVLKMLQGRSGSLADIGSGDGRVVSYKHLLPSLPQKSGKCSTPGLCFLIFTNVFLHIHFFLTELYAKAQAWEWFTFSLGEESILLFQPYSQLDKVVSQIITSSCCLGGTALHSHKKM